MLAAARTHGRCAASPAGVRLSTTAVPAARRGGDPTDTHCTCLTLTFSQQQRAAFC